MSTHAAQLLEQQLFSTLKTQIISLATPLYGTRAEDASKVYDVVSYCVPNDIDNANDSNPGIEEETTPNHGVAIILYTGPSTSPFTSWTLISHVENQPDIITGANRLLQDLRKGMGGVIGTSSNFSLFPVDSPASCISRAVKEGGGGEGDSAVMVD
jgi:hypothetical protein